MDQGYLLEMITRPAFTVSDGVITMTNAPARQRQISIGMQMSDIIATGNEEYLSMVNGCLFLSLSVCGQTYGASVVKEDSGELVLLETDSSNKELQAVSLAASKLREPLSNILIIFERFISTANMLPKLQQTTLKNSLYQMLRSIYNMSDASLYASRKSTRTSSECLSGVINEIMDKIQQTARNCGRTISYQPLGETVFAVCNKDLLERAILNLVSNAIKYSPEGSQIHSRLTCSNKKLLFTIENPCCNPGNSLKNDIFSRYLREPSIEDGNHGIGLGMVMVRSAAMVHGGTVLWEIPQDDAVRLTLSIPIRIDTSSDLRSPLLRLDYAGGRDHVLIELSDALPSTEYNDN